MIDIAGTTARYKLCNLAQGIPVHSHINDGFCPVFQYRGVLSRRPNCKQLCPTLLTAVQLAFTVLFLKLHPLPLQHTPSYENSVIFAGVALGNVAGLRLAHSSPAFFGTPETRLLLSPVGLLKLARRMLVGPHLNLWACKTQSHGR